MKLRNIFLWLLFLPLLAVSCKNDDPPGPTPAPTADRTVLVYLAADNNLSDYVFGNIEHMIQGMKGQSANLIVYLDYPGRSAALYKIVANDNPKLSLEDKLKTMLVKQYQRENSASAEVLGRVLDETMRLFPANSYGLVLWSHAKGWVPASLNLQVMRGRPIADDQQEVVAGDERNLWQRPQGAMMTKTFGRDGVNEMEIPDMVKVLPTERKLDFLLFDACFMSGVEALYDLRNSAKYIIASPTEVMADGFPYKEVVPLFFRANLDLSAICSAFVEDYRHSTDLRKGNTASVALIKTSELEALAATVRNIFAVNPDPVVNTNNVQYLELLSSHVFYDLDDYLAQVLPSDSPQYIAFQNQLRKTVVYSDHTERIYSGYGGGGEFVLKHYSGLSSYIPRSNFPVYNAAYRQTAWAQAIGVGR